METLQSVEEVVPSEEKKARETKATLRRLSAWSRAPTPGPEGGWGSNLHTPADLRTSSGVIRVVETVIVMESV